MKINFTETELNEIYNALRANNNLELANALLAKMELENAKHSRFEAKKDFLTKWSVGFVFRHSNGDYTCLYWNYKTRTYSTKPYLIDGVPYGRPVTLGMLNDTYEKLISKNFKEEN